MSTTRWYVRLTGKTLGPYTSIQLKQLAGNGHISPTTEIKREADQNWIAASRVKGLFDGKKTNESPTAIRPATSKSEGSDPPKTFPAGKQLIWVAIATVMVGLGLTLTYFFIRWSMLKDEGIAIRNASQALEEGRLNDAEAIIITALQSDANSKNKVLDLRSRISKKRVEQEIILLEKAFDKSLQEKDFKNAKNILRNIIYKSSDPDVRSSAENTLEDIDKVSSDDYAKTIIGELSDDRLNEFLSIQKLPPDLTMRNPAVNSILVEKCTEIAIYIDKDRRRIALEENARKHSIANKMASVVELAKVDNINGLHGIVISRDRSVIAGGDVEHKEIYVWSANDLQKKLTLKLPPQTRFAVTTKSIAISTDSKCIMAALDKLSMPGDTDLGLARLEIGEIPSETTLGCWDLSTGEFRGFFENPNPAGFSFSGDLVATNKFALCIATNNAKDGEGDYPLVQIWRLNDGRCYGSFRGHSKEIRCISVLPDSNRAITGGEDRIAILWDIETGKEIRVFDKHQSSVESVAVSLDESSLISGGFDCSLIHWDLHTGDVKSNWQLGDYDAQQEANWRAELFKWKIKVMRGLNAGTPPAWYFPKISRVDFSPKGNEILACLSVKDPGKLIAPSNPVLIHLEDGSILALPVEFNRVPLHDSWAAFNHDGSAIMFNRRKIERVRGQEVPIDYLSVFGTP